ncbi:MAG: hypothetical protein ACJ0QH_05310 [Flavobacteriales bacterium]
MKVVLLILFLSLAIVFFSNCSENCVEENALCSHSPPTDELYAAYFER